MAYHMRCLFNYIIYNGAMHFQVLYPTEIVSKLYSFAKFVCYLVFLPFTITLHFPPLKTALTGLLIVPLCLVVSEDLDRILVCIPSPVQNARHLSASSLTYERVSAPTETTITLC